MLLPVLANSVQEGTMPVSDEQWDPIYAPEYLNPDSWLAMTNRHRIVLRWASTARERSDLGIVVHLFWPWGECMFIKMRDENRLQDIASVLVARQLALYGGQVQLAIKWEAPPHHDWASPVLNGWLDISGCIRCISVPAHTKLSIRDMERFIRHSGCCAIISDSSSSG